MTSTPLMASPPPRPAPRPPRLRSGGLLPSGRSGLRLRRSSSQAGVQGVPVDQDGRRKRVLTRRKPKTGRKNGPTATIIWVSTQPGRGSQYQHTQVVEKAVVLGVQSRRGKMANAKQVLLYGPFATRRQSSCLKSHKLLSPQELEEYMLQHFNFQDSNSQEVLSHKQVQDFLPFTHIIPLGLNMSCCWF